MTVYNARNMLHSSSITTDSRILLSGGSNEGQGTVQVYHENQWGNICDDNFDKNDAKVLCKMIGHHSL